MRRAKLFTLGSIILAFITLVGTSEEGMWLPNQPPVEAIKKAYDFDFTPEFQNLLQQASVRFENGGSGSFVSDQGLVLTNHHVVEDTLAQVLDTHPNILEEGLVTDSLDEEVPIPDLSLTRLVSIQDVTEIVQSAIKDCEDNRKESVLKATKNKLVAKVANESNHKAQVVTLYNGGAYHLYSYEEFTDIRLAFVPEKQAAFFGGDTDNFEYPRTCLDMALVRVYQNGSPLHSPTFFPLSSQGAQAGELLFVSGHPGSTSRMLTADQLTMIRNTKAPFRLNYHLREEHDLVSLANRSPQLANILLNRISGVANVRKIYEHYLADLQNNTLITNKRQRDEKLARFLGDPKPWNTIAEETHKLEDLIAVYYLVERNWALNSSLCNYARKIVRYSKETQKPNTERLKELQDSKLKAYTRAITADIPFHQAIDIQRLAGSLAFTVGHLGYNHPVSQTILQGQNPNDRAYSLISRSRLHDPDFRATLLKLSFEELSTVDDPIIQLACSLEERARNIRAKVDQINTNLEQAYAQIAKAEQKQNPNSYPDATFSLRTTYGTIKPYQEKGVALPAFTTFQTWLDKGNRFRHNPSFNIAPRWKQLPEELDLNTPFNFVSTHDIIGGNSGSPVVNQNGHLVGLIFDGNLQSMILEYDFDEQQARAISVDSRAIIASLKHIYQASRLLTELAPR